MRCFAAAVNPRKNWTENFIRIPVKPFCYKTQQLRHWGRKHFALRCNLLHKFAAALFRSIPNFFSLTSRASCSISPIFLSLALCAHRSDFPSSHESTILFCFVVQFLLSLGLRAREQLILFYFVRAPDRFFFSLRYSMQECMCVCEYVCLSCVKRKIFRAKQNKTNRTSCISWRTLSKFGRGGGSRAGFTTKRWA